MNNIILKEEHRIGWIFLDRPKALNSLSLEMVRSVTQALLNWRHRSDIAAVLIQSTSARAFCAGGDIRFFYEAGKARPTENSALLEDFFTEEYALNYLIQTYPKPYIAYLNGVVMGGGMGIAQGSLPNNLRIVTETTQMAMPEVNIGLFPDVGGGYFLSRVPGELGTWMALTGQTIDAHSAIYAGLADIYCSSDEWPSLQEQLKQGALAENLAQLQKQYAVHQSAQSYLAQHRSTIDQHFAFDQVTQMMNSLAQDNSEFAQQTLALMQKRSPLMMCVTLKQLRKSKTMSLADCLKMERNMVRRCFENGEVLEGVRALVVDKDQNPQWNPKNLAEVSQEKIDHFFTTAWPDYAHPLRDLG